MKWQNRSVKRFFTGVFTKDDTTPIPDLEKPLASIPMEELGIYQDHLNEKLKKVKINKSSGPDGFPPCLLSNLEHSLCYPLTHIINILLDEDFPTNWKLADITVIYRNKGKRYDAQNYRPISLTSILCKTLESVIRDHIIDYLETIHLLTNYQHGFRKCRSCVFHSQIVNWVKDFLENRKQRVTIGQSKSNWCNVLRGVPQGSVLGPVL